MMRRGFTVVELIIVIVVIGILASTVMVSYTSMQAQARDAKLRNGASKIAEAIELLSIKQNMSPRETRSGWGSAAPIITENGKQLCSPSASNPTGAGFFGKGLYPCTMQEVLVANGHLTSKFMDELPRNTKYASTTSAYSYMVYACSGAAAGDYGLFYTLEQPEQRDKDGFDQIMTDCSPGPSTATLEGYNMRGAKYVDLR